MKSTVASILLVAMFGSGATHGFVSQCPPSSTKTSNRTVLYNSLKPAAIPLMDSGKALARSGELLIDLTSGMDLYGGGLSAAGAQIRNSGDCVAQAAASCRFKTGTELVCDELREGGTCLSEATDKLKLAVKEAQTDKLEALASKLGTCIQSPPYILGLCLLGNGRYSY